ncbi:VOC family protein [Georgenia satyanarayanai]|uniref:VOC family protein n=1 Tax=Georgenia satyanarayanai TaxID=860221 RepID=UPI00203AF43E|nr:VOC family protein [Georgenia satyanarayanai]MCM3662087.1 VOC family protein [Georgenia satyanarayanai]
MGRHHSIDYVEIPVHDLTVAKRFYAAAFGWDFTDYGPTYSGIRGEGERETGGLVLSDDVRPGGPLVILYSDDLEASVAAVEAAGGRVVAPPYDFPGGRRFELEDPSGHRLAVWTPTT